MNLNQTKQSKSRQAEAQQLSSRNEIWISFNDIALYSTERRKKEGWEKSQKHIQLIQARKQKDSAKQKDPPPFICRCHLWPVDRCSEIKTVLGLMGEGGVYTFRKKQKTKKIQRSH